MSSEIIGKKLEQLKDAYIRLSFSHGTYNAGQWLNNKLVDMVNKGELPQEICEEFKKGIS